MRCIQRALDDPATLKQITDTHEQGLVAARAFVGDTEGEFSPDEFDSWGATTMEPPQVGLARRALDERGYDLGFTYGQSYVDGTEMSAVDVRFDCYGETAQ